MVAVEQQCHEYCSSSNLETEHGATFCQICIEGNLNGGNASQCLDMSGASCWAYTTPVAEKLGLCSEYCSTPLDTVQCIEQEVGTRPRSCICTLLCYWSPTGDLCRSCIEEPELSELFLHHNHCPQGWIYSSSSCFKAFSQDKPWEYASRFCLDGGGYLGQPKSNRSLYASIEAMNLVASESDEREYWLGSRDPGCCFEYTGQALCGDDLVPPTAQFNKEDCASLCYGIPDCVAWSYTDLDIQTNPVNCYLKSSASCIDSNPSGDWVWGTCQCGKEIFTWERDNSPVDIYNWAASYPLSGKQQSLIATTKLLTTSRNINTHLHQIFDSQWLLQK